MLVKCVVLRQDEFCLHTMSIKGAFGDFGEDDGERVGATIWILVGDTEQVKSKGREGVSQELVHEVHLSTNVNTVQNFTKIKSVRI